MNSADNLQVFVSSVMRTEDLSAEREAVKASIQSLKLTRPWTFENSPAEPNTSIDAYRREVRASDLLVLIVSRSHTKAVQDEIEIAESAHIPILAFIRRLQTDLIQTSERESVLAWLRDRVKYEYFNDSQDLTDKVGQALIHELVRGYRRYRIDRHDYKTLAAQAPSQPSLIVRPARQDEFTEVASTLRELNQWYPHIGSWIQKVSADIPSSEVRLAEFSGELAGLSISREKEPGVRKFSTIYVRPGFRGDAIGPHLIYEEVRRAASDGVRKAYVTFADELKQAIGPILGRYGFVFEGISASRYRPGAGEWVMGKVFSYRLIHAREFENFVVEHFIKQYGGQVQSKIGNIFCVKLPSEPLLGNWDAREIAIVTSVGPTPENEYESWSLKFKDVHWLFISMYGRPADSMHWSHAVKNWIDGEDLRTRFFPVEFDLAEQASMICIVEPRYADALIPSFEQRRLFDPNRLQIRPDNVFYRAPDRFKLLRRGSTLFFYISRTEKRLRGTARLQQLRVDSPEECLSLFGGMGVFQFQELARIADRHKGQVLALVFDWYKEYADKPNLDKIRSFVPNFNPIAASLLQENQTQALVGLHDELFGHGVGNSS